MKCKDPVYDDEYCFVHFTELMEEAKIELRKEKIRNHGREQSRRRQIRINEKNVWIKQLSVDELLTHVGFTKDRKEYEDCITREGIFHMRMEERYGPDGKDRPHNNSGRTIAALEEQTTKNKEEVTQDETQNKDIHFIICPDNVMDRYSYSFNMDIEPGSDSDKRNQYDTDEVR